MKTTILQLTDDELAVISAALGELPFKHAAPVVSSIARQRQAQRKMEVEPELPARPNGHAEQPPAEQPNTH